QRMFELPPVRLDRAPVVAALEELRARSIGDGFRYRSRRAAHPGREGGTTFHAPRTLEALAALRERAPQARLLAGATDIGLWVNKQMRELGDLIYIGGVAQLRQIEVREESLWIGAGASLEAAYGALAARAPSLGEVWLRFASPPIRHAGTLGGNVANGSPIGDSAPVLMALDAAIELRLGERVRRLPLDTFYTGYMQNRLEPGEFVQAVVVPLASFERPLRVYKISKRYDCDISALCGAFSIELDEAGTVRAVRLAYGGMAAVVRRAERAEAALIGRPWDATAVAAAREALAQDFQPMTDLRAGAAYRMQVAQNLIHRFWLATRRTDPLPESATSVWSVMPHDVARPPAGPVEPAGSGLRTERNAAA
ncbi:MAG: xanthine dehydrogenase small subunit, partial [Comamonadaceae bacterium]